jgi:hypothetical protein
MTSYPWVETGLRVALDLDGDGVYEEDVTEYVKAGSNGTAVSIGRGLQSEGSTAPPATAEFTLLNGDQRFTKRNPMSPYWGLLTGNTPVRIDVPHIVSRLVVPEGSTLGLSTPDAPAFGITGDVEIRIDIELPDWTSANDSGGQTIVQKWASSQHSWAITHNGSGHLSFYWSEGGSAYTHLTATAPMPPGPKRQTLVITMDVDNGAGGHDVNFYATDSLTGTQEQIGETVTGAGVTSIYDGTATVLVGYNPGALESMQIYGMMILDGIGGTPVSTLDLTGEEGEVSTVEDVEGNTWTVGSGSRLETRDARFTGVIPSWEPTGGITETDSEVHIVAYDELRRLGRSKASFLSTYRRAVISEDSEFGSLVGYVPMEDVAGSQRLAAGIAGQEMMTIFGTIQLASNSEFLGSLPLPTLDASTILSVPVPPYADTGEWKVSMVLKVPSAGFSGSTRVIRVQTNNPDMRRWNVYVHSAGTLGVTVIDEDGGTVFSGGPYGFAINGYPLRIGLSVAQDGADATFVLSTIGIGDPTYGYVSGTLTSVSVGRMTSVTIAPDAGAADTVAGQLVMQAEVGSPYDAKEPLNAFADELVVDRVRRLCEELGVPHSVRGGDDLRLGPQSRGRPLDALRAAELTDGGILHSPRSGRGVAYRSRDSLCARAPVLSTSYALSGVKVSRPVDGDRRIANKLTVTRTEGAGVVVEETVGPLSTQDPPDGVGEYESSVELGLCSDDDLLRRALWELHVSTVDAPRYPLLSLDLGAPPYMLDQDGALDEQKAALRDLDIGDRLLLSSPPSWVSVNDIDQIAVGLAERIGPWVHEIDVTSMPYEAFRVGVWDAPGSSDDCRWSSPGVLVSMSDTELVLTDDVEWAHDDGDYVVTAEGEDVLVTAVSGTIPTFTLTIERSVNGVYKAHSAGEIVEVKDAFRYGV